MRNAQSPSAQVLLGTAIVALAITVLSLSRLPAAELTLLGRFLVPSALLWLGVYGILEHKRN
jgi:hypothetical protein